MTPCQSVTTWDRHRGATRAHCRAAITDGKTGGKTVELASEHLRFRTSRRAGGSTKPLRFAWSNPRASAPSWSLGVLLVAGADLFSLPGRAGRGTWAAQRVLPASLCRRAGDFSRTERKEIPMTAEREPCCGCSCTDYTEAHYAAGRLVCSTCWSGREPPVAMPPTPAQREALARWCAPRAPRQQSLDLGQAAQPQGSIRG